VVSGPPQKARQGASEQKNPAGSEKWPRKPFLRFCGLSHKHLGSRFAPID